MRRIVPRALERLVRPLQTFGLKPRRREAALAAASRPVRGFQLRAAVWAGARRSGRERAGASRKGTDTRPRSGRECGVTAREVQVKRYETPHQEAVAKGRAPAGAD